MNGQRTYIQYPNTFLYKIQRKSYTVLRLFFFFLGLFYQIIRLTNWSPLNDCSLGTSPLSQPSPIPLQNIFFSPLSFWMVTWLKPATLWFYSKKPNDDLDNPIRFKTMDEKYAQLRETETGQWLMVGKQSIRWDANECLNTTPIEVFLTTTLVLWGICSSQGFWLFRSVAPLLLNLIKTSGAVAICSQLG